MKRNTGNRRSARRGLGCLLVMAVMLRASSLTAEESICYGTAGNGRLQDGVMLPLDGPNYRSYSVAASLAGRTHVHSKVRDIVVAAYRRLEETLPEETFVYAETGWPTGGEFDPHKTHQNGLSVDFMVPVVNNGKSVPLPTNFGNRLGYDIEFDERGTYRAYTIDFEAMAAHLDALHQVAKEAGIGIRRVIFDPALQPALFATAQGADLRDELRFSDERSWVRHDEHYHVDFDVDCRPLATP